MKSLGNPRLLLPLLVAGLATLVVACGGDEGSGSGDSAATGVDRAFVEDMIPHHEAAVEMAEMARERGQHAEVRTWPTRSSRRRTQRSTG